MLKCKKILINLTIAIFLASISSLQAKTWRLEENQSWDLIATNNKEKFLTEISDAQKMVDDCKTKAARKEFKDIKENHSEFSGPDLDLFIKAELLLSQKKLTESARNYDKLLTKYSESLLSNKAVNREYEIGMTFLDGRKKIVLGLIPIAGYEEGISILEKMIDHAGIDKQISIDASVAIAKNYEKREKFNEAYLKWWEIYSLVKKDDIINRDALLGMAKAEFAIYNRNPESKKPFYDGSCLLTAKTYFEMLKSNYPEYAQEIGVSETLNVISEELAHKELSIGLYYQRTGNKQSANLYFDMVISDWPKSRSAETAQNMLDKNNES
jgi:tetratricopeptide (TPR) repeat protein